MWATNRSVHGSTYRTLGLLSALALSACSGGDAAGAKGVMRFSAIPSSNTTELREKFQPLAAYLSETLGVPVEYVPSSDYPATVEAFKNGDVHLAWFGGLTGVHARSAVAGARAIATGKIDLHYKSYFIANRDSGLQPSDSFPHELAGKKFTFGSKSSTSGRLMPEYFLRQETGQSPAEFFGAEMNFSGSHDNTALQVQAGTFDAGALDYKRYDRLVADGKIDPEICFILWTTPEYADYQWTAHPEIDSLFGEGLTDRLQATLVAMHDPELLAAIERPEGLIEASNSDFENLAKLATEINLLR